MYCRICGDENNTQYYFEIGMTLCPYCREGTPNKVSRQAFDRAYWGKNFEDCPNSTRREFYSDYLASKCTVREYIKQTTSKY